MVKKESGKASAKKASRRPVKTRKASPSRDRELHSPKSPWTLVFEDGEPESDPAEPRPPVPPPLQLESRPGLVNVAAVCSEGWMSDFPKQQDLAAYYAGRLWNAIRWLQDLTAFHLRLWGSIYLEIERLGAHLKHACGHLMTPAIYESQGRMRCDELVNWRPDNRFGDYLEGLRADESGNEVSELDSALLEPGKHLCFQLLGITEEPQHLRLRTVIDLGIAVDRAIRPWRNGDRLSPRFQEPWVMETMAITDATFATNVEVITSQIADFKVAKIPTNPSYVDFQNLEKQLRTAIAGLDVPTDDEDGIFDLVLNRENKTIRRKNWKHSAAVVLGNWYDIVRELATTDGVVLHQRLKTLYGMAFRGQYRSFAQSFAKTKIELRKLGLTVSTPKNLGRRLVELPSKVN